MKLLGSSPWDEDPFGDQAKLNPPVEPEEFDIDLAEKTHKNRKVWGHLFAIIATLGILFFVQSFIGRPLYVPSESMQPTINCGDRILLNSVGRYFHSPDKGTMIVFHAPQGANASNEVRKNLKQDQPEGHELWVKRLIAKGGDTVRVRGGKVWVNQNQLKEPYANYGTGGPDFGPIHVPKGQYFVLGDNRSRSADSRYIGSIPASWVQGTVFGRIWPSPSLGNFTAYAKAGDCQS